jgi:hexokinase
VRARPSPANGAISPRAAAIAGGYTVTDTLLADAEDVKDCDTPSSSRTEITELAASELDARECPVKVVRLVDDAQHAGTPTLASSIL